MNTESSLSAAHMMSPLDTHVLQVFDMNKHTGEPHPLNKKAKCRVYLRDLQREFNLSDGALQHIALICGPRWDVYQ
jgi:hypothetical protein